MSRGKGATKCPFKVTRSKLTYVEKMQGAPMKCFDCGRKIKEGGLAVARWNGHLSVYYHASCANRLLVVTTSP